MADQVAGGLLSPYLRKKRFQAAMPFLKGRILDFGCGTGALAVFIDPDKYLGVEIDSLSLQQAKSCFPKHRFFSNLPEPSDKFDTVVSLAVIEHVSDPAGFLRMLAAYLDDTQSSHLIITTPHPCADWIHYFGSAIGLFSKDANEEHGDLMNRSKLEIAGNQAGLKLVLYSRFLFGVNQIAVYAK